VIDGNFVNVADISSAFSSGHSSQLRQRDPIPPPPAAPSTQKLSSQSSALYLKVHTYAVRLGLLTAAVGLVRGSQACRRSTRSRFKEDLVRILNIRLT
jgi:hypothetical protein